MTRTLPTTPVAPYKLAHAVLRTAHLDESITYYRALLSARVVFEQRPFGAGLTYDEEHHRIALLAVPEAVPSDSGTVAGMEVGVAFWAVAAVDVMPNEPKGKTAHTSELFLIASTTGGLLYGRGAADMKGAIACFAAAAIDYAKARGRELDGSISLLITGDEEGPAVNGTRKVLAWMKEKGERPDHCLVGEPTNAKRLGEAIKIGRRGSLNGTLKVSGVQGHVAYPHFACNPVKGVIQILARLYDAPLDYGSAHFSPSNLEVTSIDVGNPTVNVIPAEATARFNVRYNDRHQPESLIVLLRDQATLALSGAELSYTLDFEPPSHTFLTEPGPLDALLSEAVHEITGLTPSLETGGGTSDARFIKDYCPVIEFGLLTATIHKADEHVAIADLEQLTAIYRRFIELYFERFGGAGAG